MIISEVLMVITVAVTVLILAFVVSGYWLNSDFEVERQGMLQISSTPTGADVAIDGETAWLQRTNTSKILAAGKHEISLTKEGYDSWSRTVDVKEGLIYRLHYPRLFLTERTKEEMYDITGATFATVSPDHNTMLLSNNTTSWKIIRLNSDKIETDTIDIAGYFPGTNIAGGAKPGVFTGNIISANWSRDNSHILFKVATNENRAYEWVILNTKNIASSINLTRAFDADFTSIKIIDDSANTLLAVRGDNLHRIDVSGRQVSSVLIDGVVDFDYYDQEIVFSAKKQDSYQIGTIRIGDAEYTTLRTMGEPARLVAGKFYDQEFIAILCKNELSLYDKKDFSLIMSDKLEFVPKSIKVGHGGDFVVMSDGGHIATLDMEASAVVAWSTGTSGYGWLDGSMIYAVNDGVLIVYDYDGLNRRELSKNVSSGFPVTITDDKWLYYFSDNKLTRETIIK